MRPDGSDQRRLTHTSGDDIDPVWLPMQERTWHSFIALATSILILTSGLSVFFKNFITGSDEQQRYPTNKGLKPIVLKKR